MDSSVRKTAHCFAGYANKYSPISSRQLETGAKSRNLPSPRPTGHVAD